VNDYWAAIPRKSPEKPPRSPDQAVIDAAIERGNSMSAALVRNRDALFPAFRELLLVAGAEGLRACVAGVTEAVIAQHEARVRGGGERG
jgi:hypothetical protein